jgi:hypothetical protein
MLSSDRDDTFAGMNNIDVIICKVNWHLVFLKQSLTRRWLKFTEEGGNLVSSQGGRNMSSGSAFLVGRHIRRRYSFGWKETSG